MKHASRSKSTAFTVLQQVTIANVIVDAIVEASSPVLPRCPIDLKLRRYDDPAPPFLIHSVIGRCQKGSSRPVRIEGCMRCSAWPSMRQTPDGVLYR
ncbi:hypothetical protein BAUCODRAFT_525370 [Baudoinia panamericana UAMH 10762]|uniref:Uncharacterized protein n=1 Tax=Baudoinia panamericana (strain UAMH 10762) TaxID=717646 RepID=M2MU48_BAUPA|nr:uncharacterized protein BAUCODRAFT_525370 [Baudoinia panamericana UAMH 10762]EMC95078.1 hypothetical protein BAUCODRAFT_525370 [Baudoinia panamericana UAMH 10762]